jgi:hypothetical protein
MFVLGDIPVDTHRGPHHTGGPIPWEGVGREVSVTGMLVI